NVMLIYGASANVVCRDARRNSRSHNQSARGIDRVHVSGQLVVECLAGGIESNSQVRCTAITSREAKAQRTIGLPAFEHSRMQAALISRLFGLRANRTGVRQRDSLRSPRGWRDNQIAAFGCDCAADGGALRGHYIKWSGRINLS